jgi:hypothetical protein
VLLFTNINPIFNRTPPKDRQKTTKTAIIADEVFLSGAIK